MGSHSVTCRPTQVNAALALTPPDGQVLNLPTPQGCEAELT